MEGWFVVCGDFSARCQINLLTKMILSPENFKTNFIRYPRIFCSVYLSGELSYDDKWVLDWLWQNANPMNGVVKIGYAELSEITRGNVPTNQANKVLLTLKRQKFIAFERRQGRRGSFEVKLSFYPCSNGGFTDDNGLFASVKAVLPSEDILRSPTLGAEVMVNVQKLEEQKRALTIGVSMDRRPPHSKTTNNDNNNQTDTNFDSKNTPIGIDSFKPNGFEEQRCLEVAKEIGETDLRFVLSVYRKHGIAMLEEAIERFREVPRSSMKGPGKYFNGIIENLKKRRTEDVGGEINIDDIPFD